MAIVIRKQNIQNLEEENSRGPLTALKRMVTIPGELNMDHLKFHIILESGKKMEKDWNKRIRRSQVEMKEGLWSIMYIKVKTLRKNYKEAYELQKRGIYWREYI